MPIYEYQCQKCGYSLERLQKISEPALVTCENCQQDSLQKIISASGFRLSGSGWYESDFKTNNKRNLSEAPSVVKKPPKSENASAK